MYHLKGSVPSSIELHEPRGSEHYVNFKKGKDWKEYNSKRKEWKKQRKQNKQRKENNMCKLVRSNRIPFLKQN